MRSIPQRITKGWFFLVTAISLFGAIGFAAPPAAPDNLQPAWLFGEILLRWNEVPGVTSYNVYRYDSANNTWIVVTNGLPAPRFRENNSGASTYTVTAVNSEGESAGASPVDCIQTGDPFWFYFDQWNSPMYDTSAVIQWTLNLPEGADGMLEVGTSPTNLTFVGWDTNYTTSHRIAASNLTAATWYYGRITSVASNRTGVSGWITFNTLATNRPPNVENQIFSTWEDPWQPLSIWFNAWDPDYGQPVTVTILSGPSHGTITQTNYWFTYMPETNWFGTDLISFAASDGQLSSQPATITINVSPVDDAPVGINQSVVTGEDIPVSITLQATDIENDPVYFWISAWPTNGWIQSTETSVIYTSATNRVGIDRFAFIPYDTAGAWGQPAYVTITITNVNDPPVASNLFASVHAEATFHGNLSAGDVDGDSVICELVSLPASGTATVSGTTFTYTPNGGSYFSDSFTYRAFDGQAYSSEATVWIWVGNTNRVPQANDQSLTVTQNTEPWINLDGFDLDGDALTIILVAAPTNGTLEFFPYLSAVYRPTTDYLGPDAFSYQVYDGTATSSVANVSITVVPPNEPPFAVSSNLTTMRDNALSFRLTASDPDGDPLTYIVTSSPAHGVLTGNSPDLTYTPASGFIGTDSFNFKANDGTVDGNTATITITTTRLNQAPVAASQSLSLAEDTSRAIVLTATDTDGDPLTFRILSGPAHGSLTGTGANRTYTPSGNYSGLDSFTFTANDGLTDGNIATVDLTITPVNDAPVILSGANRVLTLREDWIIYFGVLASDPDGDTLTYRIVTPPSHGTLNTANFQSLNYQGFQNFAGTDSFTWVANDGQVDSPLGRVTIIVTNVNDAPVTTNQVVIGDEDSSLTIVPLAADPDNDPLTLSVVGQPQHGTISILGTTFNYLPATNFNGSDAFSYRASDGTLSSSDTTISITVRPVNDPPTANSQTWALNEDTPANITLSGADIDGNTLSFIIVTGPLHGTLSGTGATRTYTPAANYHGPDSFTFHANDGTANSAPATITLNVSSINDTPSPANLTAAVNEDSSVSITLSAIDADEDALTFAVTSNPTNGTLSGTAPNLVYTPNANFNGVDHFTYTARDSTATSDPATATITVNAVNDLPVASNQSLATDEDTSVPVVLSATDVDGDALTYTVVTPPAHGTLSGSGSNRLYTPDGNFHGADSFTFRASDATAAGNLATVSITVRPVNDAPTADFQNLTTPEDTVLNITLNGSDVDGDSVTFTIVGEPSHGTLSAAGANLVYTPNDNYNGPDAFTFKVNDGTIDGSTATVSINVVAVNDPPVANAQSLTTAEDTAANINLTGSDVDGDTLTFAIVSGPSHGTLSGTGASLLYTPNANYNGPESFTFKVNDRTVDGNTANVTINVTAANDTPVADAQSLTTPEDTAVNITLSGSDVDGDSLTFAIVNGPSHGTLSGSGANVIYTPNGNYNGPDSFAFKVNDGAVDGNTATVILNVTAVNDLPVANAQSVTAAEDTAANITLTASDVDGDTLSFAIVSGPSHGTLSGSGANVIYTPNANYNGPDSFTFKVNDGTADGNTANVSINVTAINDLPVANAQSLTTAEDTAVNITLGGADVDGDVLSFAIVSAPSHGTLLGTGQNLIYSPNSNYNGPDGFTFKVNDGTVDGNTASVSINVTAINDLPVANAQSLTTAEDTAINITLGGSDVDGDALTFAIVTGPSHGTLSGTGANVIYTPNSNYNGPDTFTFKVNDGAGDSTPATVSIAVSAINDAPTADNQSISVAYNSSAAVTLTGSDIEGNPLTFTIVVAPTHGTLSGVAPNLTYTPAIGYSGSDSFTLRASDGALNSAIATVSISVQPPTSIPAAPSALTATAISATQINLAWTDNSANEDGFKIERSTDNRTFTQIGTVGPNVRTYASTGLSANKNYYYRVRAYNSLGNSAYSNTATTKTLR